MQVFSWKTWADNPDNGYELHGITDSRTWVFERNGTVEGHPRAF